jgi:1,5-anhydro-D-fructose reductase (1,5-anhydro-D-mannitol-forming)
MAWISRLAQVGCPWNGTNNVKELIAMSNTGTVERSEVRGIGVIGLGSIGTRMLGGIAAHSGFAVVRVWDPSPSACARASATHPELTIATSAQDVIDDAAVDLVYVACPPRFHREHALAAIDAGKPILCEKPLGVDLDESRDLVQRIEQSGSVNAVNLLFASARASHDLGAALHAGELGELAWVDIHLHLPNWAARRYAEAPWLAQRMQGGFIREVTTHAMFLCQRLFGAVTLQSARIDFPADGVGAERFAAVQLDANGLPININGTTLGAGPELQQITFWGAQRSMRIRDLHTLEIAEGDQWRAAYPAPENVEIDTYTRQLDNLAAALDGQAHTLASFRDALETQELIEAILER